MKFIGAASVILLCYAGMLLGGSPVGPPQLEEKYASWSVASHHEEMLRNISEKLMTVDDCDTAIQMLAVITASRDIAQEHRVQIVEALAESITTLGSTLGESKNPSVARLAARYVRYALECMMDLAPESFLNFPDRIGKANLKPSWAVTLTREYLACLWTVDAQHIKMGQSALGKIKATTKEDVQMVEDIKFRFRLFSKDSQEAALALLFEKLRPSSSSIDAALRNDNRVDVNKWLAEVENAGYELDPLISLRMAKSLGVEDIAGRYTLLDWSCRSCRDLSRKRKADPSLADKAKQTISEVDNFYRQHGSSIKKAVAGNPDDRIDYLQETVNAVRKLLEQ
jgi:hypothetical protein